MNTFTNYNETTKQMQSPESNITRNKDALHVQIGVQSWKNIKKPKFPLQMTQSGFGCSQKVLN